jgi:predicted DsbA family dithiol-disulfide isomerase
MRISFLCLLASAAWGQTSTSSSPVVAIVAGQSIHEDDLKPLLQSQSRQAQLQEYEQKSKALENLVNQKVLEAEAKKKGIGLDKLLAEEVDATVPEATDAEVEAFYLGQRDRVNRPFDEVKDQLRPGLRQAKIQRAREVYLEKARARADVAILLRPPLTEVGYDPARVRGNPKAAVTIVEFSDFQCPFCVRAQSTVREVLARYGDRVKLAYRDFPLHQIHPHAQMGAEASRCAGEQGKFWEYHDLLFEAPGQPMDQPALAAQAKKLQLDASKFEACLTAGRHRAAVERDLQDGVTAGVSGTPAFFVNGVLLSGAQPLSAFQKVIDAELARLERVRP